MANKMEFITALKLLRYCRTQQELQNRGNTLAYLWHQLTEQQQLAIIADESQARTWYAAWHAARNTA